MPGAFLLPIGKERPHDRQLMESWEDLLELLLPGLLVLLLYYLRVVLDDVRQALRREGLFHRYSVFRPAGFGGFPAPSSQPRLKGRNHDALPVSLVQNSTSESSTAKMHNRALERKDQFLGVPVIFVLLDRVAHSLFGQAVLQLESDNGHSVDEKGRRPGKAWSRRG